MNHRPYPAHFFISAPLRFAVLIAAAASCVCSTAFAGDRLRGGLQRAEHHTAGPAVAPDDVQGREADAVPRDYVPPPYLSKTRNGGDAGGPGGGAMGVQDSRPSGRMSAEERKQLRKTIQDAGRDVYKH
jgi:hypothetical protein